MQSLLNLRCHCHVYFDPTTGRNMHNTTHTPRIGQPISIDAPTLLFTAKSINTAHTYPSVTLAAASPKPKKVHCKNQVTAFQHYKINYKKSLSLPYGNRLVIDHHKTAHDQVFCRLHWLFNFLLSQDSSVHFLPKSELRLSGLSPLAVTYKYASMSSCPCS